MQFYVQYVVDVVILYCQVTNNTVDPVNKVDPSSPTAILISYSWQILHVCFQATRFVCRDYKHVHQA